MPKVVDHGNRRRELLPAVWKVTARDGVENVTLRAIAAETGWSTGTLQHYFPTKRELIISAHELAYSRAGERIADRVRELKGVDALRAVLLEALPLDDERLLEARVEVSAWNLAATDEDFRAMRKERVDEWMPLLEQLIADSRKETGAAGDCSDAIAAHQALILIDALSAQAVVTPHIATPARQRELVERFLIEAVGASRR
ncbi:TetR/AcrR family transcriptional regulator [Streptomyces sp. NPDC055006]